MERMIVHINITNFMAAVESSKDPSLRRWPFIIAPEKQARAVVLGVSDLAFHEGLQAGMPLNIALKRLPGCRVLVPSTELYETAQRSIYNLAARFSPTVEMRSNGHLFIDLTGTTRIFGHSIDAAATIKQEFQNTLGLDPTTALAVNKVVSKVASRVVRPHGFASVPPGDEGGFMTPQSVTLLPGIGPRLESRMGALGILFMGELGSLTDSQTVVAFGAQGTTLKRHAMGIDTDPVLQNPLLCNRITHGRILETDSNDPQMLRAHLALLCEHAGFTLRSRNRSTTQIHLEFQYSDMKLSGRQATLNSPVHLDRDIYRIASGLMEHLLARRVRVRKLTLSLGRLHRESHQLDLFEPPSSHVLQQALDHLRSRYGQITVQRASSLGLP
ncbi:hypothetical protein KKF84_16350 [Myxococcota bacterium]|nr:hypothetical protein [Myxococcota bacterium]MBU1536897.1 hypothetical protein [Myxococcota bacterium]